MKKVEKIQQALSDANACYRIMESYKVEQPEVFRAALHTLCSNVKTIRSHLAEETGSAEEEMTDRALFIVANLSHSMAL